MANGALLKALMGEEYEYQPKESSMGALSYGIAKSLPEMVNPYGSTAGNMAAVLGGSLLAGLFGYSAKREAEEKNLAQAGYMQELLSGGITPEREREILAADPKLRGLYTGLKLQNLLSTSTNKAEEAAKRQKAELDIAVQYAKDNGLTLAEAEKRLSQGFVAKPNIPAPVSPAELYPGIPADVVEQYQKEVERLGQTIDKKSAEKFAGERILKPALDRYQKSQKEVETARSKLDALDKIIVTGEEAILKAGATGGPESLYNLRKELAGYVGAGETALKSVGITPITSQAEKLSYDAALDSLGIDMMSTLKGLGSVSNIETTMAVKSGITSKNTPEQNMRILKNTLRIRKATEEWLKVTAGYGADSNKAAQIWNAYKRDELFANNKWNDNADTFEQWASKKQVELPTTFVKEAELVPASTVPEMTVDQVAQMTKQDLDNITMEQFKSFPEPVQRKIAEMELLFEGQ